MRTVLRCVVCCGVLPLLAGCGGDSIAKGTIRGTITFEGEPIETGEIVFEPANGPSAGGRIVDGQYSCEVALGETVVRINANRPTGEMETVMGVQMEKLDAYVPACYNAESTLTATPENSVNTIDFALTADCQPPR